MKKLDLIILQIDLGRQKETVDYLKHYIDFAKENGYNAVLLYLEAAVKVECTPFFNADECYTPAEIREVVAYGNKQGIDIIPGLENLSHAENFMRHKELEFISECKDAMVDGRGIFPGLGDCVCTSNADANAFFDTYYTQVVSLFTSQYVHAGMDEPFDFAVCPRCTARLQNGETKQDIFYEHLMRTYNLLKGMGKQMMMWDDFFEYLDVVEKLPRDIIMCNWNYGFITDEPQGHWINRKTKDWFRLYDKLGFQYLFCPYGSPTSKLYNTDSFTAYAEKHHPKGVLMTMWERSSRLNLASYPCLAYSGRLWSGKATKADKLNVFTEYLGSKEAADIVLNVEAGGGSMQPCNLNICENRTTDYALHAKDYAVRHLKAILDTMEDSLQKDILQDIYTITLDGYLSQWQHKLCIEVFDNYESRSRSPKYFTRQLLEMKALSNEAYAQYKLLWEKYRPGIRSFKNRFAGKFEDRAKRYDNMIAQLEKKEKKGVFYAQLMLSCVYGTPRIVIELHYKDKSVPPTVYKTSAKVSGGINTVRFAMENKALDYALFTVHGEGASYPVHFRYTYGGNKYVVSGVTKVQGEVKNLKRLLLQDTQFAQVGTDDGQAHFEDVDISRTRHQIKLKFKRMK